MPLQLISSSDDRALLIRDRVLPLVRERGTLQTQRDAVRLTELRMPPWLFRHWTPFNELNAGEAASPGYRRAVERQRSRPELVYGLEVWLAARMLQVLWSDDGRVEVASFVRGAWEDAALAL